MFFSNEASCLTNGAVGGDRGWAAAFVSFRLAVETASEFEAGENMKMRNPIDSTAASTRVIGLVLRSDRGRAIMEECGQRQDARGIQSKDTSVPRRFEGVCLGEVFNSGNP